MKKIILLLVCVLFTHITFAQIGTIKAEKYQSEFEKKQSIEDVSDYDGKPIPIALLNISATDEVYQMWPDLKDARIGLGVTNMVIEYLEYTNRFQFVEEKSEIKNRMKDQWKASKKGVSENEVYGFGKIKLANYFVTIEIYDFSVSDAEDDDDEDDEDDEELPPFCAGGGELLFVGGGDAGVDGGGGGTFTGGTAGMFETADDAADAADAACDAA